jgi:hypothetical protein
MADITGHTPGPWSIGKRRWITSGDLDIARIHSVSKIGEAEAVANAEFIIRACNSHDALLEALEATAEYIRDDGRLDNIHEVFSSEDLALLITAEEAIAKAKGGA